MIKESNVAARGQVFYYNPIWGVYGKNREPKTPFQNNGSLEYKTRPYLVISTDKGNFSSTTCNIIPITSRDNIAIPSQVKFVHNGRNQVILTEQITTCNFRDLGKYCYTVNEEVLAKVQEGLYIQFSMNLKTPEVVMEELVAKLEVVVDKVLENAKKKAQSVVLSQDVLDKLADKFSSAIEDLVSIPKSVAITSEDTSKSAERENQVCSLSTTTNDDLKLETMTESESAVQNTPKVNRTPNYLGMSPIEKFNARYSRTSAIESNTQASNTPTSFDTGTNKKTRKQPWSIEKQRQFLKDCDSLTPEELVKKYELKTKKDVYTHKYLIKARLENLGNSDE